MDIASVFLDFKSDVICDGTFPRGRRSDGGRRGTSLRAVSAEPEAQRVAQVIRRPKAIAHLVLLLSLAAGGFWRAVDSGRSLPA
jgi:hypothetical protein